MRWQIASWTTSVLHQFRYFVEFDRPEPTPDLQRGVALREGQFIGVDGQIWDSYGPIPNQLDPLNPSNTFGPVPGTKRLFRVVSTADLKAINNSGEFNWRSKNSTPTGKPGAYFWDSLENARAWQAFLAQNDETDTHIVTTTVENTAVPGQTNPHGDGIETSYFYHLEDFTGPIFEIPNP